MSDDRELQSSAAGNVTTPAAAKEAAPVAAAAPAPAGDSLDAVEDIDFLLEEIENKIAPLALA